MKYRILIATVLFILLSLFINILTGCDGGTGSGPIIPGLTPSVVTMQDITETEVIDPIGENAILSDDPNAFRYAANQIRHLDFVKAVYADEDEMLVEYDWGGTEIWMDQPDFQESGSSRYEKSFISSEYGNSLLKAVGNKYAVIYDSTYDDPGFAYDKPYLDDVEKDLKATGFTVVSKHGSLASVDSFKEVKDYGVILYTGHGGLEDELASDTFYSIMTGEPYSKPDTSSAKFEDWKNKRIESMTVDWGKTGSKTTKTFWAVTNKYFDYYKPGLNNSLFFNLACEGMKPSTKVTIHPMAASLINLGAGVYLGWTKSVSNTGTVANSFIKQMCTGLTVGEVYNKGWEPDPSDGGVLKYYPENSTGGGITLK
ncbi:MAG: hypothetical protein ABRQ38_17645 [Candidatus Eremiobacterota bacterium]